MQRHIISVNSITYAIKGRDFLRKQGFRSYIERKTSNNDVSNGCGYVIIADGNLKKIVALLNSVDIKILDIKTIA